MLISFPFLSGIAILPYVLFHLIRICYFPPDCYWFREFASTHFCRAAQKTHYLFLVLLTRSSMILVSVLLKKVRLLFSNTIHKKKLIMDSRKIVLRLFSRLVLSSLSFLLTFLCLLYYIFHGIV